MDDHSMKVYVCTKVNDIMHEIINDLNNDFKNDGVKGELFKSILVNLIGNATLLAADETVLSDYKTTADQMMDEIENFFEQAIPFAIQKNLMTEKGKKNVN